jgi:predicted DsbA family dithiol-disulfide isomerase
VAAIHAFFYTDPACPWSWSIEPAMRRLGVEFGETVELRPVMGGLAREFGDPLAVVADWLAAADASGMPVDPRLWIESPPASSYPACLAVKAAAEQGRPAEAAYLRVLREGFAARRRKLDGTEALTAAAREVAGLDVARFQIDLQSNAVTELFGADLDRAEAAAQRAQAAGARPRSPGDTGPSGARVQLPSLELHAADGAIYGLYGAQPYEAYGKAAEAAGASRANAPPPSIEEALRRFGTMATAEVAAVCDLPGPRASAELWRLAAEWRVRFERCLGGELWSLA